ncbi:retrovirus-related pol polyprotein from transposon TNT 1-94 [Tanacetum coccineum]
MEPIKEVRNGNPFDVLNSVKNDMDLGTNANLASKKANPSGSLFWNVKASSTSTTHIVDKIDKYEKHIIDGKVYLVDDKDKPLKKVSYMDDHDSEDKWLESKEKAFQLFPPCQNEVNDIRAEKIDRNGNLLALFAATQQYPDDHYQAPKPHKPMHHHQNTYHQPDLMLLSGTKTKRLSNQSHLHLSQHLKKIMIQDMLREINRYKKVWHSSQSTSKNIYKPTNNNLRTSSNTRNKNANTSLRIGNDSQNGQFVNHRTVTVARARETIGNQVVQQSGIQCLNCKGFGHFAKECRKPKRAKDYPYHKEKMMLRKQEEKGVPLSAEHDEWFHDTDEEPDEQELEAHYMYIENI